MSAPARIPPTQFESIRAFQSYFQVQDELPVPANQQLELHQLPPCATEDLPQDLFQRLLAVVNRILSPLGKKVALTHPKGEVTVTIETTPHLLSVKLSLPYSLKLEVLSSPLVTRIDRLFQMMIASSIFKVTIAPSQPLIITGLTEATAEQIRRDNFQNPFGILSAGRVPAGFSVNFTTYPGTNNYELQKLEQGLPAPYNLRRVSTGLIEIELKKVRSFENAEAFFQEIPAKGELVLSEGTVLRIENASLNDLIEDHTQYLGNSIDRFDFLLSHLLLPYGKGISSKGQASIHTSSNLAAIEVPKGATLVLKLTDERLFASVKSIQAILFPLMQKGAAQIRTAFFTLKPDQELLLYGLKREEIEEMVEAASLQEASERISWLFLRHTSLVGYQFLLITDKIVNATIYFPIGGGKEDPPLLGLKSAEGFQLVLARSLPPLDLALQVVNLSHPELRTGLIDGDYNAMSLLLFRIVFHCCCEAQDWGEDLEKTFLQGGFKEETIQKMRALKKDAKFQEVYQRIQEDLALKTALQQIFEYTPDDFAALDAGELEPPLKQLIGSLRELGYAEFQGGEFLQSVISLLVNEIAKNEELAKSLFKRPLPAAEEAKASSAQ